MKKRILTLATGLVLVSSLIISNNFETNTSTILDVKANTNFDFNVNLDIDKDNKKISNNIIVEKIATFPEEIFEEVNETVYIKQDIIVKDGPYENSNDVLTIKKYESMNLIGKNDLKYWKINYQDNTYYIDNTSLIFDVKIIDDLKLEEEKARLAEEARLKEEARRAEEKRKQEEKNKQEAAKRSELNKQTKNPKWDGSVLTKSKGVNYGPTGKETYYNLPMNGVIKIMRRMGNNDEYWVREDGVKMLGDYIMCAANLDVFPRGTLVESSLGTCIVCDTGGFAAKNPYQLDIAVAW